MIKESSDNPSKNKFLETTNAATQKIDCKDGFCPLPNKKEIFKQNKNDLNLFEPI